jgi:DnaJ-class molecular chaperone
LQFHGTFLQHPFKLAVKYHPDKNKEKDAEEKFREIAKGLTIIY